MQDNWKVISEAAKKCETPAKRIAFLKDNCDKVVNKTYSKKFTPSELQKYKEELVNVCDKIDSLEEEKKSTVKRFKLELDPLHAKRKEMIGNVRSKAKLVDEMCYQFTDFDTRYTSFFNDEGDLIETRPATADELQLDMFKGANADVRDFNPGGGEGYQSTGTEDE